jgi:hypothetical protein
MSTSVIKYPGVYILNGVEHTIPDAYYCEDSKTPVHVNAAHRERKKNPHVWLAPTPYARDILVLRRFTGAYSTYGGDVYNGTLEGLPSDLYDPDMDPLAGRALNKALQSLKAQKVDLSTNFFERKQTANLVTNTVRRVSKCFNALKHGNIGGAANALGISAKTSFKGIGESWLELQYGWKPLLSDIFGACDAIRSADLAEPKRYRATVRGAAKSHTQVLYNIGEPGDDTIETGLYYEDLGVKVRLDFYLDNPVLAQASALGITNPLNTAWEELPYSFVADWFIPVGSFLSGLDASLGYSFLGGSESRRYRYGKVQVSKRRDGPVLEHLYYWYFHGGERSRRGLRRSVYDSNPMPYFPTFKNPLSMGHMANAIALLQNIKSLTHRPK